MFEALIIRDRSQLDAARLRLATLERAVGQDRHMLAAFETRFNAQSAASGPAVGERFDPLRASSRVAHLAQLRARIDERRTALAGLEGAAERLREECRMRQHKLDLIEERRASVQAEAAHLDALRAIREADESWSHRLAHSAARKDVL